VRSAISATGGLLFEYVGNYYNLSLLNSYPPARRVAVRVTVFS